MAMRVALAARDEVLCRRSRRTGGWVFKHTGDGVCRVHSGHVWHVYRCR